MNHSNIRNRFIASVSRGRTFADVGGLYEIIKEKISIARSAGATEVTLIDIEPLDCVWWEQMRMHLRTKGTDDCEFVSEAIEEVAAERTFDVVYSSGVLYHRPDPLGYLKALKRAAKEHVILASTILPSYVPGPEPIVYPPGSVLYLPAVPLKDREQIAAYFSLQGRQNLFKSSGNLEDWYANWWFPTQEALIAMCEGVGFKIVDHGPIEEDPILGYALLLGANQTPRA